MFKYSASLSVVKIRACDPIEMEYTGHEIHSNDEARYGGDVTKRKDPSFNLVGSTTQKAYPQDEIIHGGEVTRNKVSSSTWLETPAPTTTPQYAHSASESQSSSSSSRHSSGRIVRESQSCIGCTVHHSTCSGATFDKSGRVTVGCTRCQNLFEMCIFSSDETGTLNPALQYNQPST